VVIYRDAGAGSRVGAVSGGRKWRHRPSSVVNTIHAAASSKQSATTRKVVITFSLLINFTGQLRTITDQCDGSDGRQPLFRQPLWL